MEAEGKESYKKGLWTAEEDKILVDYVNCHGKGNWNSISKRTGLKRCGKSCRLRWMNYLSPSVKKGNFTEEEEDLIIRLHKLLGNRWSLIAGRVPGRTDNQVKNYWNTHLSKKLGIKKKETGRTRSLSLAHSAKCGNSSMTNSSLESSSSIETDNRNKNICTTSITTDPIDPIHFPQIFNNNTVVDDWKENGYLELITTTAEGEKRQQQPTMINIGSENYGLNSSSMWVSEFDGLLHGNISNNGSSFTELIDGHSFDLDWDYL